MDTAKDFTGLRCGKLVALKRVSRTGSECYRWLWQCDCGRQVVRHKHSAKSSGHCGCMTHANLSARSTTHGASTTQAYKGWAAMKDRCLNPNNTHYSDYGGRGITVCQRWVDSYENFLADMGPRQPGMTLDRHPDPNGNYEPGNCRWASRKQQQRNRRNTVMLTVDGVTKSLYDWCDELGLRVNTVVSRIKRGWDHKRALLEAVDYRHRNSLCKDTANAVV
jgi:hypothetical protein